MKTDDILVLPDFRFGRHRFWQVLSICLGAEGQEGLIELRPLTERPGVDVDGNAHKTTWVPEALVRDLEVYVPRQPQVTK